MADTPRRAWRDVPEEIKGYPADSPCRSGCTTKDHDSYAACLKAAAIQIGNLK